MILSRITASGLPIMNHFRTQIILAHHWCATCRDQTYVSWFIRRRVIILKGGKLQTNYNLWPINATHCARGGCCRLYAMIVTYLIYQLHTKITVSIDAFESWKEDIFFTLCSLILRFLLLNITIWCPTIRIVLAFPIVHNSILYFDVWSVTRFKHHFNGDLLHNMRKKYIYTYFFSFSWNVYWYIYNFMHDCPIYYKGK